MRWEQFISKAHSVHGESYAYHTRVDDLKSTSVVEITCPHHGVFKASVNKHISAKTGCPSCAKNERLARNTSIRHTNVNKTLSLWQSMYPQMLFAPSECGKHIIATCKEHGDTIHKRISSTANTYPCKICGHAARAANLRASNEEYIKKATITHNNRYEYHTFNGQVYAECQEHGLFELSGNRRANHVNQGAGCSACKLEFVTLSQRKSSEEFVAEAFEIHQGKYTYPSAYINIHTKVEIVCPEHGSFFQTPLNHLQGIGCPMCTASSAEQVFFQTASKHGLKVETQKTFPSLVNPLTGRSLRYDFFLPQLNVLIELDGRQHYYHTPYFHGEDVSSFNDSITRDEIKNKFAALHNINLYRIPYTNFKDIPLLIRELVESAHIK